MKLLIITQKVDAEDDVLGFFYHWLEKLSHKADLVVITNYLGKNNLPKNVQVFSLGKEKNKGKIIKFFLFQKLLLKHLGKVDGVFFHMCPEYVLAAGLWPYFFKAKTLFWYTHKKVDLKLKLAVSLVDKIFTASKKSFRLKNKKVEVVGHGIDTEFFRPPKKEKKQDEFNILSVGRISPVKNIDILIQETEKVIKTDRDKIKLFIIGSVGLPSQIDYEKKLHAFVNEHNLEDSILFLKKVPHNEILSHYQEADVSVNLSDTGSLDKTVLESMACGTIVLTSNEAFEKILKPFDLYIKKDSLAENLKRIKDMKEQEKEELGKNLRQVIIFHHSLDNLIDKIVKFF